MKDIRIIVLSSNQKDVLSKLWEEHGGTRQSFSLALIGLMILPFFGNFDPKSFLKEMFDGKGMSKVSSD